MADEIDITTAANQPKSGKSPDGTEFVQQSLADLVAAKKYVDGQAAANTTNLGIRFRQIVPPGPRD